jgi:hypothetical protein
MAKVNYDALVAKLQECSDLENVMEEFLDSEDMVFPMDSFDEMLGNMAPLEIVERWGQGYKFNPYNRDKREDNNSNAEYFAYNGSGNIATIDDDTDLAYWIADNVNNYDEVYEYMVENGLVESDDNEE